VSHFDLYKTTQDGPKAWLSLEESYEGEYSRQSQIRDAINKINTSRFERERRTFSFEDYCNLHLHANLELKVMSASPDVNIQIKTFMDKIICEAMKSHKIVVLADNVCQTGLLNSTIWLQAFWNLSKPTPMFEKNKENYYRNICSFKRFNGHGNFEGRCRG
jgi:hypothetical protein